MTTVHDFGQSLSASHAAEDLPFWEECYRKAFPTFASMVNHRHDGPHQRAGIDRSVILGNAKQVLIDEKVRWRPYSDILLEWRSDAERGVEGWVCKPLLCDYIAYAIAPLGKCYLLPVVQLQSAWERCGDSWLQEAQPNPRPGERRLVRAVNKGWTTVSVVVSPKELFREMTRGFYVEFSPVDSHQ